MKAAAWADPDRWRELVDGRACPICVHGAPLDVIAELGAIWVTAPPEAPLPHYACIVSKRHVVEPYLLPDDERRAFWEEAMVAARVLHEASGAVKMNYGIHGNVIPHLHLHLWPRFPDDPYDTGGIPAGVASFSRSDAQLAELADAFRAVR